MGRRRLEVGEHGTIRVETLGPKHQRAYTRIRCRDGIIRKVQADGQSKQAARDAVVARANDVAASTGRARPGSAVAELTPVTLVSVLADKWWEQKKQSGDLAPQTIPDYAAYNETIKGRIGELQIRQVTPGTLEWLIEAEAPGQSSKGANLRRQLRAMFALAIRHDAYDGENPAREMAVAKSQRAPTRALTVDELQAYRKAIRAWVTPPVDEDGKPKRRGGRPRSTDIVDIVDMQVATGARIAEVLALRWCDIDLNGEKPTASIFGTLVRLPGGTAKGAGLIRQEHRKAKDRLIVTLPAFAVAILLRLKVTAGSNPHDVIFTSASGTLRSPENLRTQLRKARGKEWAWVQPHTFRKTVATLIDAEAGVEAAASQLGHKGTAVTSKHYVERSAVMVAGDASEILEKLAPDDA
ncbi:putative integrase [Gordonia phage GMA4]|uniref:putative integrase n=1 Tax=Gordonia phage GMA4 TaxID=1647471 RepID=UPI0006BCB0AF|nr:putative integrase [Gordonia phage GMA4]AKJ72304.1 putative integrase [Gordonia phage GMA4]